MPGIALFSWPLIALIFFKVLGPARGLIWSVIVGYLFLPENYGFDLPGLPNYNKQAAIALACLLGFLISRRQEETPRLSYVAGGFRTRMMILLAGLLVISPVATMLTNGETLVNGPVIRQALTVRDIVSMISDSLIWFAPFLFGWRLLVTPQHHRELLVAMVVMGLAYTPLVLFELRMSPQLNNLVYGYFPHSWIQHVRGGGGFRPIVFLRHGLWLGFFLFTVAIAAFALSRDREIPGRAKYLIAGIWVFVVLALSRNLAALMIGMLLVPVILFLPARLQTVMATTVSVIFVAYPVLKQSGYSPDRQMLEFAETISAERAASFKWRTDNETMFLDRALEKPFFGWGGWARGRVFDERGNDLSTGDGVWILVLVQQGWLGYICFFGLLILPIFALGQAGRRKGISPAIMGIVVMTTGNLIYLIPNSTLSPIGLMAIGALAAFVQKDVADGKEPVTKPERQGIRYSRFPVQSVREPGRV